MCLEKKKQILKGVEVLITLVMSFAFTNHYDKTTSLLDYSLGIINLLI